MGQKLKLFLSFFAALFLLLALSSCSKNKNLTPSAPIPQKIKPNSVEALTFSYDFKPREYCEGYCNKFDRFESCETVQSFKNKKELCDGLKDAPLNNFCARKDRAQLYKERCGGEFDEVGLKGFTQVVQDSRVGSCSYTIPDSTGSEYCANLADEEQHKLCGWEERRILFKQYECKGTFSNLSDEILLKDNGVEVVTEPILSMTEKSSIVHRVYRKTFKIPPVPEHMVLQFTHMILREENCDVEGHAFFTGTVISMVHGSANPSSIGLNIVAKEMNLFNGYGYEIVVDVQNPGLCQDFEYAYTLQLSPK